MILKEFRLEDKVAIVTGGGRGIGKAIALTLAEKDIPPIRNIFKLLIIQNKNLV